MLCILKNTLEYKCAKPGPFVFLIRTLPCIEGTKLEAAFLRLKGALISC